MQSFEQSMRTCTIEHSNLNTKMLIIELSILNTNVGTKIFMIEHSNLDVVRAKGGGAYALEHAVEHGVFVPRVVVAQLEIGGQDRIRSCHKYPFIWSVVGASKSPEIKRESKSSEH